MCDFANLPHSRSVARVRSTNNSTGKVKNTPKALRQLCFRRVRLIANSAVLDATDTMHGRSTTQSMYSPHIQPSSPASSSRTPKLHGYNRLKNPQAHSESRLECAFTSKPLLEPVDYRACLLALTNVSTAVAHNTGIRVCRDTRPELWLITIE